LRVAWGTLDAVIACPLGTVDLADPPTVQASGDVTPQASGDVTPQAKPALPRANRPSRVFKATFDLVLAAILLVLVSPLLLALMIAIRLDSPGYPIFRQVRIGKDGQPFGVLKLRTMVSDAEELKASLLAANECEGGVLFKIRRDPRITRFGSLLRRSSVDELPQLVNVLRGQMSLVGPRPALPDEVAAMDQDALRRFAVRPGMTGLWQVSGRSNLGWTEARAYDTYYAENWTVVGDLSIILRTAKAVVSADGAC